LSPSPPSHTGSARPDQPRSFGTLRVNVCSRESGRSAESDLARWLRARAGHCGPPLSFSTADVPGSSEPHDKLAIMTHINRAEFENAAFEVNLARAIGLQRPSKPWGGLPAVGPGGRSDGPKGKRDAQGCDDLPALFSPRFWTVSPHSGHSHPVEPVLGEPPAPADEGDHLIGPCRREPHGPHRGYGRRRQTTHHLTELAYLTILSLV
jgi:hypothetical protein